MDVSVIIVNWNVRQMLADCLRSLEQYHGALSLEIIVVDSASSDGSVEMLRQDFPEITLLAESDNIGFVKGNNLALSRATGRYLFLLNPDTLLHPHALTRMVDYLESHPEVGIVGPHTLNSDGSHQSTRRRFPTVWSSMIESTWWQDFVPAAWLDWFYVRELANDGTYPVDWVQGSALLARREVYEQIGGLDTRYVMFFEELDWCKRAKTLGWEVVYMGDAIITHYGGGSTEQVGTRKHLLFQQSKLAYTHKFHGRLAASLVWGVLVANYGLQVLIEGGKLALRHKPDLRRQRIHSYSMVLKALFQAEKQP